MPNWSDDEGRFWFRGREVPHAPVVRRDDCGCEFCTSPPPVRGPEATQGDLGELLGGGLRGGRVDFLCGTCGTANCYHLKGLGL